MNEDVRTHGARIPWSAVDETNDVNRTTNVAPPLRLVSDSGSAIPHPSAADATDVAREPDWHASRGDAA